MKRNKKSMNASEKYFLSLVDELNKLNLGVLLYKIHYIAVETNFAKDNQTVKYNIVVKNAKIELQVDDYNKIKKKINKCGACKLNIKNISKNPLFVRVPISDFYEDTENNHAKHDNNTDFFLYSIEAIDTHIHDVVKIEPAK